MAAVAFFVLRGLVVLSLPSSLWALQSSFSNPLSTHPHFYHQETKRGFMPAPSSRPFYDAEYIDLVSTELSLLYANQQFYEAFRAGDFDSLCDWLHPDECISVIHPGIPPLYGRKAVIQSWRSVLKMPPHIVVSEPRVVQINADLAWLHCFETLEGSHGNLIRLVVTNIFKRDYSGQWRIVLHHAGSCM